MIFLNNKEYWENSSVIFIDFDWLWVKYMSFWLRIWPFSVKTQSILIILTENDPIWLTFLWKPSHFLWQMIISHRIWLACHRILSELSVNWLRNTNFYKILSRFDWVFSQKQVNFIKKLWKWLVFMIFSVKLYYFFIILSQKLDFSVRYSHMLEDYELRF